MLSMYWYGIKEYWREFTVWWSRLVYQLTSPFITAAAVFIGVLVFVGLRGRCFLRGHHDWEECYKIGFFPVEKECRTCNKVEAG